MPYFTATPHLSVFERVTSSANTALARDSSLAEAWMSLGVAHMHGWRWAEARSYFERGVAADPTDVQTHFQFGRFHLYRGDNAAALASWTRAKAIDPFSALAAAWSAYVLAMEGRIPEALAEAARARQYDSVTAVVRLNTMRAYLLARRNVDAVAMADGLPDLAPWNGVRAYTHAMAGSRDSAMAIVRRIEATPAQLWFRHTALAYAYFGLGDTGRALDALERATDAAEIWPSFYPVHDPIFNPVRRDPRWAAIVRRVNLGDVPGALPR